MTKKDKVIKCFLSNPKDLTWAEYVKFFEIHGFTLHCGDGSKRRFINEQNQVFTIHEPHPSNIMKPYTIKEALKWLKEIEILAENDKNSDKQEGSNE